MTSGKDFIIGHAGRDLVLASLKHYHLGALKVVWELERRGDVGISVSRRRSEQRGALNSRVSCPVRIPPHHKLVTPLSHTSFYHTLLCNVLSGSSPLVAGINLCLEGFWTCAVPRCGAWMVLSLMHVPEGWSISRGMKALLIHLLLAGDRGRCPGVALFGSFKLSLSCGPCDRRRSCMARGWCLHFRSEPSRRGGWWKAASVFTPGI